ncbi:MAG: energy-coupling factor transporter transmembrane protein EcfT [Spirochaetales bacterium]|nr:energy-coupling factor transporter transmembrane protein EcfT [Spirochaetales bacterium]
MAEYLIFHYQKGNSFLHRTDVLIKFAGMISFSFLLLPVSLLRLAILLPVIITAHFISSIRIKNYIKEGGFFLIMGSIILIANTLSSGSFLVGLFRCIRFFLILWMALLFTFTTDPMDVSSGIYRFLKPLPFIPARRFSTILGLSLTMLPLILDLIREIREAMLSRGGMSPWTPFRNLTRLGLPLLDGILVKAEDLSDAMESRLFTEDATPPEKQSDTGGYKIVLVLLLCFVMILLGERYFLAEGFPDLLIRHY